MANWIFRPERRAWVTPLIIALNVVVFLAWHYPAREVQIFLLRNFLVSWNALAAGRYWTLLGSVFSHEALFHIFVNMFVLNSFGSFLEIVIGVRRYLAFYLAAGIFASLSHSLVSAFLLGQPDLPALGASGAIAGVILVFALLFPREKILLFGLIPVPALWGALGAVGLDLWGLLAQTRGGGLPIGYGAHLGGALAGVVYYFLFLRRLRRR